MDWDKLRIFYYVAKAGSFIGAAEMLNLTQSTLSRSIQILEHSFHTSLFNRVPKGVTLTKQGEILFERAQQMFMYVEEAKLLIQDESAKPSGKLKVASSMALASLWLSELLPEFLRQYPDIQLEVTGNDDNLERKTREADVAIRAFAPGSPDLIQNYLFSCCLELYASPTYLEKFGTPQTPQDLDHHRLLTLEGAPLGPYYSDWSLRIGAPRGRPRTPYLSLNSSHALSILASKGIGIVGLSKEFPHIEDLNLVRILPDLSGPIVDIYYTYPYTLKDSERVRVLGKYLQGCIPEDFKRQIK